MAWWLTVYSRKSVAELTCDQIATGLRNQDPSAPAGVDYVSLGEEYGLDAAVVQAAIGQLEVVAVGDGAVDARRGSLSSGVELRYTTEAEARPIHVHVWADPARVAEEVAEALEGREPPESAIARVRTATQVVGIELGYSQIDSVGLILACELARYLAQKGDGVFVDDDNEWYSVVDGGFEDPV